MSINIGPAEGDDLAPKITVIGVGGAGGNAIANMMASEIEGVEFVVANTDAQALSSSPAEKRIQLGTEITRGLGAGAKPEVGRAAAEETVKEIEAALEGINMVFIAAGMGGGTGTGAAPVIAETARRMGVLTVGVVTKPFLFEGTRRMRAAEAGIADLQEHVDTLIVIPNQNLFLIASQDTTFKQAFEMADEVLQQGVRSITDLMVMPGLINLDFADVRSVMSEMGKAMMGTGEAAGDNRAKEAAEQAIANPLLDGVSMQGAKGVIISIIGGEDMKLFEVDGAANHIRDLVDEDANIIWGSAFNPDLDGKIRVSVVATGIEQDAQSAPRPAASVATAAAAPAILAARPPQRPVLDLGGEVEMPAEETVEDIAEEPRPEPAPITLTPPEPEFEAEAEYEVEEGAEMEGADDAEPLLKSRPLFSDPVSEAQEADEDGEEDDKPFDLSGMQAGDDMGEIEDDVDEIIDPLAGLRGAEEEPFDLAGSQAPEEEYEPTGEVYSEIDEAEQEGRVADAASEAPPRAAEPAAAPQPSAPAPSEPSTLFERMANLSRSSGSDDDEDDDDGAPALSIPRFLGRQNNQ
ncbi:MAG: cell division protein FtsZ [Erythrobacter sp.]|nr:cell division protein FtsZ [Erythrobacter sp.]